MKPGWQTSEFWITIASVIITSLSVFGYIQPEDFNGTNLAAQNIVLTIFSSVNSFLYIYSRLNLKRMERFGNK
jgi:hypothetical protein